MLCNTKEKGCKNMDFVKFGIEHIVYPLMEKKNGNKIRAYTKELQKTQSLTREDLHALQTEKLKKLLACCKENVPAYADIELCDDPWETLSKIPPLMKKEFQKKTDAHINTAFPKEKLIPNTTGGSTGEPTRFYMDRFDVEHYEAARWRGLSWWGITQGSRSILVWGNPLELNANQQKSYRRKEKWLKNRQFIPAYELSPEKVQEYVRFIDSYRPEYLYGYATSLYSLASMMQTAGIAPKCRLKAVLSTSETLHPYQRELIEKVFGCAVINEYGARDAGILAYACPEGHLHITSENAIIELVDPKTYQPVKTGESGLVVVTDLNNFAQPRLRYVLGDMATARVETECKCGVTLPMLECVDGREDDMLVRGDGTLIHGHAISHLTRKRNTIVKFKIVQTSREEASLVVMQSTDDASEFEAFVSDVREMLSGVEVTAERVDDIPPEKSGKTRYAIRKFSLT